MARFVRALTVVNGVLIVGAATFAVRAQAQAPAAPATQTAARPAAAHVTSPKEEWGHNIGDDYFLVDYQQAGAYWHKLEKESNRIHVKEIGKTSEGRPQLMAIVTSPANYAKIDRYRQISAQLSHAEGLTDAQAQALAKEGKAVVWIDGGLHASEVLGAQQLVEWVYQMVSRTDEETMRFLNDVIILNTFANPDGMDLISDGYMKYGMGTGGAWKLWNHYAGHDDNRDSYMNALDETTNVSKVMFREWFPQIMYNHHQTGPNGAVMFAPPFRDPFNYNFHPGIPAAMDMIGAAIATRSIEEKMPGVVNREGQNYSTWWNGGFRTIAYFHNELGILTETIGNPTPMPNTPPLTTRFLIGNMNDWYPITPTGDNVWHFRRSIDYSVMANRAIIDLASKYRETFLYRIYEMGRDEIQFGKEDHWTFTPHKSARVEVATCGSSTVPTVAAQPGTQPAGGGGRGAGGGGARGAGGGGGGRGGGACPQLFAALTTKDLRDPRGFIIPSDQPDFGTAVRFVNALIKSGITIERATASFTVAGKTYPANSLIVKTAQAFRPHVMDMFEPQDHPDDIPYPGAPPTPPYDSAGWTLAFQMGVKFDRELDDFSGPFERLTDFAKAPAGSIKAAQGTPVGYYFTHQANDSFIVVNRLLAANEDVSWLWNGPFGYGTFYVASKPTTAAILQKAATDLGISFQATTTAPTGPAAKLRKLRIGLVDNYGGSMPVGWTRLIFKNFEFPFVEDSYNDVFAPDINAGNLHDKYDVLVFNGVGLGPGGGGRGGGGGGGRGGGGGGEPQAPAQGDDRKRPFEPMPEMYAKRQGAITQQGVAAIQQFVQDGGTIICIGQAAGQAITQFKLPLASQTDLPRTEFYVPGSVMQVSVDPKNPLAHGAADKVDVFFDEGEGNAAWKLTGDAAAANLHSVAWFADAHSLRSGWAWGEAALDKGIEMAEATVGKGRVFVFGNALLFRSQPHGNYKFFFNALYLSVAPDMKAGAGQ